MSKTKRGKSGGSTAVGGGLPRWEQGLLSTHFEEDTWKGNVTFVAPNKYEDVRHIDALSTAVSSGLRKLFSIITREELYAVVKDLGNPKNKKAKEVPANFEVCEACKQYLDLGEEIPVHLLAKLLKFRLLDIKTRDMKRRDVEKKGKGKERVKSGKKGGKKTPDPPAAKEGSKLKKRGEEDADKKYIDDEPDDGPEHYILVQGFNDAKLIAALSDIGVNVNAVIRVSSQEYPRPPTEAKEAEGEKDDKTLAAEAEAKAARVAVKKELKKFWSELLPTLQRQPDSSKLHDVARLDYEVPNLIVPSNLEDAEQKLTFGTAVFEDIACKIYDLVDAKRQYHCYMENIRLISVPECGQPQPPPSDLPGAPGGTIPSVTPSMLQTEADMRYYNDLMSIIPQESVSVPLIMHCMLEQIVATEEDKTPPSAAKPPPRTDGLNDSLASHISSVAFKLALSEEEHNSLTEVLELPERPPDSPRNPLLMNRGDEITKRTQHLKAKYGFNPEQVERDMLKHLPLSSLCQLPRPSSKIARERSARLQELIHFCCTGGLTPSEIDRAFKQFVLECMDLTCTDPNGFIVTKEGEGADHTSIPWDDPYPYFKGMMTEEDKALYEEERKAARDLEKEESLENVAQKSPVSPPARTGSSCSKGSTPSSSNEELDKGDKRASRARKKKSKSGDGKSRQKSSSVDKKKCVSVEEIVEEAPRPESSSSHKSILRSRSRSASGSRLNSRTNSVHFNTTEEGHPVKQPGDEEPGDVPEEPDKTTEESLVDILDAQKRDLDQWCFAEHFEPHVLAQVLKEASYCLPFVDTYYHKRDNSLLIVLHNPYNSELQNHVDWHTELHCNVGFRNYLEHVSHSVTGWVAEIEASYQAQQLTSELQKLKADEEAAAKAAEKGAKAKKSPRKSQSKSPKSSRPSSVERPQSANEIFLRPQSIKAWKMEQEQLQAEAEELERQKQDKKSKADKRKDDDRLSKASKRPNSRNSSKSKTSQKESICNDISEEVLEEPETYWPFTGYDMGNNLIHVSGITTTMFPVDGGQIRTQKTEFLHGQTSVETSVLKDGHVFVVHLLDPHEEEEEEPDEELRQAEKEEEELQRQKEIEDVKSDAEEEEGSNKAFEGKESSGEVQKSTESTQVKDIPKKPSVSGFGSVFAQLSDGMCLAFSTFGATGDPEGEVECKEEESDPLLAEMTAPSPTPQDSKASAAKVKKEKGKDKPPAPDALQESESENLKDGESGVSQLFQQLYVTCPDGLNVRYFLESSIGVVPASEDDRRLVVRMSYPFKTQGTQPCESIRKKFALTENCRTVTTEGTVVKHMTDGTVQVLYSDGTVSTYTTAYGHLPVVDQCSTPKPEQGVPQLQGVTDTDTEPHKKSAKSKPSAKSISTDKSEEAPPEKKWAWMTTLPSGERTLTKEDGEPVNIKPVMVCLASDPETKQSMATRDDHVITISYPDGTTIVEHNDGTRITTYYRENQVPVDHEDTVETGEMPQYALQQIKFVKVECLGYATIEFNCDTSENLTVFGNGTTVNVFPDGYYMIHHSDGGRFEVDPEGSSIYYPRPNKYMEQIVPDREIQYALRHNADVICETVDPDGNAFSVKYTGDTLVTPAESEEAQSELSSLDTPTEKKLVSYKQHAPRFFVIHKSGRGTELLRYQDVAEYLDKMEQDPSTAMLQDPMPDFPGASGITVLKPIEGTPCDTWLKKYDMDSIMPPGIRSRDLTTLPPKEVKTDGPMFGTNLGKGLCVGAAVKQASRFPVLKCPNTIEIRQLIQYRPVGEVLRKKLQTGLKDYAEFVKQRITTSDMLQVQDPRSEEEKTLAERLQALVTEHHPKRPNSADVKAVYEKATEPTTPSPPHTPTPKRTKADWERDQRERQEEQEGREALRHKKIPPYFDSELGKAFLHTQGKDMEEMMRQLSADLKHERVVSETGVSDISTPMDLPATDSARQLYVHSSQMSATEIPLPSPPGNSSGKMVDIPESPKGMGTGMTPSGLRPGNPTPAHAAGQGSPAPLRPKNPTPSHSNRTVQDRPGNPTPTKSNLSGGAEGQGEVSNQGYPSIMEQPEEEKTVISQLPTGDTELILTRSLAVDVKGELRTEAIRLPNAIQGGRPGALPNIKYKTVEDPVRRNVRNMMATGATIKGQGQLQRLRGLNLMPEEVQYGVLKEGYTYAYTVSLRNTGSDSCRFKIRQPPPSTGLRALYKPGPVAAGMKVDLCLELYAIAVGVEGESGVGAISHNLEIITEVDNLYLPIRATVLTAHEYENRSPDSPRGGKSPGTRLVSTRPPANTGIIRPRKESHRDGAIPVF